MDDYPEEIRRNCPQCDMRVMLSIACQVAGCDGGYIHMHEYDAGEFEACTNCKGRGVLIWCKECGYSVNDNLPVPEGFFVEGYWY